MSPPISKDLWLVAAISSTTLPSALAQPAPDKSSAPPAPAGIVAAISPGAQIKSNEQILYVGSSAVPGQRIVTGKDETVHVLMQDQSALTLAPESELVIDEFRYDETSRTGKIRLSLNQGVVRVVGGYISKNEPTAIKTPNALVEISGGISLVSVTPNQTQSSFLFGNQMRVTSGGGEPQTVTRPGFSVSSSNGGPSSPQRNTPNQLQQQLNVRQGQLYPMQQTQLQPPVESERSMNQLTSNSGSTNTLRNVLTTGSTPAS